jgi:hypothetical protein
MKKAVLVMPDAAQLRSALRAIRHMQGAEMALVLPPGTHHLSEIAGLAQVLTWVKEAGKDVTLIGGTPEARAEAVAEGWRVSTSLDEWERWLAEAQNAAPMRPATNQGWRIFRASAAEQPPATDAAPLAATSAHPMANPTEVEWLTTADQHEDAIIALIWQTGKLTEVPAAFYAD